MANISHEIRTPLNVIIGMHHQLSRMPLAADQLQVLGKAERAADALREIVDTVLDYSNAERGLIEIESAAFDLRALIADIGDGIALQAQSRRLQFTREVDAGIPSLLIGDMDRLRQVLMILLDNALKFTARGSVSLVVRPISSSSGGVVVEFAVGDTGPGINDDELAFTMRPFSQGDSSSTRRHGGIGMGLATAVRLVKLMGGEIQVDTELGKGSEFRVVCPFRIGGKQGVSTIPKDDGPVPAEPVALQRAEGSVAVDVLLERLREQVQAFDTEALVTAEQLRASGALDPNDDTAGSLMRALSAYDFEAAAALLDQQDAGSTGAVADVRAP